MKAAEALARLRRVDLPAVTTADAAAVLGQSRTAASQTLARLATAGLLVRVRSGVFWLDGEPDPLRLPEHLTAPFPSYVSLLTALHQRGVIEQIPEVVYAASLGRTQHIAAAGHAFSIHHLSPDLFGGFEVTPFGVKLATAEKALFDCAYLASTRARLFARLPEVELPRAFRRRELTRWCSRIDSPRKRTLTERWLEALLARAR